MAPFPFKIKFKDFLNHFNVYKYLYTKRANERELTKERKIYMCLFLIALKRPKMMMMVYEMILRQFKDDLI